jgi:hypothetical protein
MNASRLVAGIWVNPMLPDGFWDPPEGDRPDSHLPYTSRPFILTVPKEEWVEGYRFDVYCFHESVWGRPLRMFHFVTLNEAIRCIKTMEGL